MEEVEELFKQFDYDGSGTIEVAELHKMFEENGIYI